ncbi:putative sugar O-methyltransferase [Thermodesulfobacteriota bacterium]
MFVPINQNEFMLALETLNKIRGLLDIRECLIEQGDIQEELSLPSPMWKLIKLYSYVLNPSYDIVNTWRLHTFMFTGHYLGGAAPHIFNPLPDSLKEEYHQLTAGLPSEMIARPPRMLGEIGWEINGGVVNKDVLMCQNHIGNLYFSRVLDYVRSKDSNRVLEIGSGYGGLAYFLWKILKPSGYYLVDLPESLAFSSVYLTLTGGLDGASGVVYDGSKSDLLNAPKNGFVFLPNFLINDLSNTDKFDLVINTGSFGEMTKDQVVQYVDVIEDILAEDGIIYEDNGDSDMVPIINIFGKRFKCIEFHKNNKNNRIWAKNEETLSKVKIVANYRPSVLKTPRTWLQWRVKRTLQKLR